MSGRYRYEPSNGWLWILPPVGPSFASVYEKSASGADSNTRAVREIVIELNRLLDRAVYAESHRLTAETALDEAIARADKASNALIRTTAALRETTDRAEKAEARVAELEREVAAWSPARHYGPEDDAYDPKPIWHTLADGTRIPRCPTHGYGWATEEWGASRPPVLLRVTCQRCSWASGPIERAAPPQCPTGASGGDHGPEGGEGAKTPRPVLGHPRAPESSNLDTAYPTGESSGPKVPDRIAWFATPEADAFRVYDEMLRNPGHPQRGLTPEEVDLTKPQTLRAYATFGEASPENSIRILVDPAAAAEVEARTGAVVSVWSETRSTGTINIEVLYRPHGPLLPPRAGLPSRDEVAAFLEARWRTDPRKPCVDPDCLVCRMGL